MNLQYQYEDNIENWIIAALTVHFTIINIGPSIIDLVQVILSSMQMNKQEEKEVLYQSNGYLTNMEERPSNMQTSSIYDEDTSFHHQNNCKISLSHINCIVLIQCTCQIDIPIIQFVCSFDSIKPSENPILSVSISSIMYYSIF